MSSSAQKTQVAVINSRLFVNENIATSANASIGLLSTGAYVASSSTPYISSATTVKEASELIATKLHVLETTFAPTSYVDQKVADLINSAPGILDTLGEIATSLGNDANLSVTLVSTIAAETGRATLAEQTLSTALISEKERAILSEETLSSIIASESSRAISIEESLSTIIASETSYARAQEQSLSTIIASETSRAISQEQYLSTTLHTEIQRALQDDENVSTIFTQEVLRATGVESVLSTSIVTERIRAIGAEESLSTGLAIETMRAISAEEGISSSLVSEISRATAAETTITQNLSTVQGTYINKDGSVKMTANLDMSGSKIVNLSSSPVDIGDAVSLGYYKNMATMNHAGTISVNSYAVNSVLNPTNLDVNYSPAGTVLRVMGQTAGQNTGVVVYTVSSVSSAVSANNAGEWRRIEYGSLNPTGAFNEGSFFDLSANNTDGSGVTFSTPYDLTASGNDLRTKYPAYALFRIPLTSRPRFFIYNDAYTGNMITTRMDPGDIFEFGGNGRYYRITYRAPIDAAAGGSFNFDFLNRPNYVNFVQQNAFYTQFTSSGSITANFRKVVIVKNSDLLLKTPNSTQWEHIDVSDPYVQGTASRIKVSGNGPQLFDFVVDISPDYAGQPSIATVGNVTNGSWNATPISAGRGGTGQTSYANGDILFANAGTLQKLALGGGQQVIKSVNGFPAWQDNTTQEVIMSANINGPLRLQATLELLSTSVGVETSRATTAETTLSTTIVNQISSIISAAPQALDTLNEIAIALGNDPNLAGTLISTINSETARAINSEGILTADLLSEISRASAAEGFISTFLTSTITAERERALAAEANISTVSNSSNDTEMLRAIAVEQGLSTSIASEIARATAAESALDDDINSEILRATEIEQGLSTILVQTISNLSAESDRAIAIEQGLSTSIASEISRATGVEAGHNGRISTIEYELNTGLEGEVLKYVGGVPTFATNNTVGVSISDATNFSTLTTLQGALDYLFNFTQTRKIIQHVVASSTDYSDPATANAAFAAGKVHFINYDASNTEIYLPKVAPGVSYPDGTVYRIVHNGDYLTNNYTVKYANYTTSTTIDVLELAPRDTISLIWDSDSSSYLTGVGL